MKIIPTTDTTISQGLKGPLSVHLPHSSLLLPPLLSPIMPKLGSQPSTWATVSHQREAAILLPWHQQCLKNDGHCKRKADMNGVCWEKETTTHMNAFWFSGSNSGESTWMSVKYDRCSDLHFSWRKVDVTVDTLHFILRQFIMFVI